MIYESKCFKIFRLPLPEGINDKSPGTNEFKKTFYYTIEQIISRNANTLSLKNGIQTIDIYHPMDKSIKIGYIEILIGCEQQRNNMNKYEKYCVVELTLYHSSMSTIPCVPFRSKLPYVFSEKPLCWL